MGRLDGLGAVAEVCPPVAPEGPGLLHGRRVTVKEWIDDDATAVRRLRAAGAVVVARTRAGEQVRNPWDPTRTAGQSSSGEGVTVSTGVADIGLGSDSGGSLRFPAHCCGIAALRPTYGRVPVTGHRPRAGLLVDGRTVIGPLARSVADLGLALSVVAGPDGRDPTAPPVPLRTEPVDVAGLRVAVHRSGCASAIGAGVDRAVAALAAAGAVCTRADVLDVERSADVTTRYWRRHELPTGEVERLLRHWDHCRSDAMVLLDRFDAILSPASPHVAPLLGHGSLADWTYTLAPSLWGWPALALRAGDDGGLPFAVQIVAGPWREDIALALGAVLEAALPPIPLAPMP